mgnify:CR=1 FL=1
MDFLVVYFIIRDMVMFMVHVIVMCRLTVPAIYMVLMATVFSSAYDAHPTVFNIIWFVMFGCVAISWIITLIQKIKEVSNSLRK